MKQSVVFMAIIAALMVGLGFSPIKVCAKATEAKTTEVKAPEAKVAEEQVKAAAGKQININEADAAVLTEIPGIGPKTAEAILAYRKEVGQFKTLEELIEVKGIGPKKLESIRPYLQKI